MAESQLRKGALEMIVLGVIEIEPTYGAALVERLHELAGIDITTGTLYPLLSRLRKQGVLQTEWEQSPVGPPRKIYSLSAKGKKQLTELHKEWKVIATAVDAVMAHGSSEGEIAQ